LRKCNLMLSTALVAVVTGAALADTDITSSKSDSYTTGTLPSGSKGTGSAGNITIGSGGSISVSNGSDGAIRVNDNSFVEVTAGAITNKDATSATGILVDMTQNPDPIIATNTANTSHLGIDFASGTSLIVNGSGTSHTGIWLNNTNIAADPTTFYTYTGPISFDAGSIQSITGDSSQLVKIDQNSILTGDLTFAGTATVEPSSTTSTTSVSTYGLLSVGEINGNVSLPSGGILTVTGAGSTGMSIQGQGVIGSISIGGNLSAVGITASSSVQNIYKAPQVTGNPDAGSGLAVGANVTGGIAILGPSAASGTTTAGSVSVQGTAPAVLISPAINTLYTSTSPQTSALTIGTYDDAADNGFSFLNRGTISATPSNVDEGAIAIHVAGGGAGANLQTILTGGFYNSGSVSASATTTGNTANSNAVVAIEIDNYAQLGANLTNKNAAVSIYDQGDQAAFVNSSITGSGTISAQTTGTRGGTATAIYINQFANVPSILNSGTISAIATATDPKLNGNASGSSNQLGAAAIVDASGTLTSIYNTGTIEACAGVASSATCSGLGALDNNTQVSTAIDLRGGSTATASGAGVTITDQATGTKAATILGNIYFGTGDNQIININGTSSAYMATISGNVYYGSTGLSHIADQLNINAYGEMIGKVLAGAGPGVAVFVDTNGTFLAQNDTTALNAYSVDIKSGGNLSLGVSESLTNTGVIATSSGSGGAIGPSGLSQGQVDIEQGANLGVAYDSFVPQGTTAFTLITTPKGDLTVDPTTITLANTSLQQYAGQGGSLPFLFQSANLAVDTTSSTSVDKLVLNVQTKTATQLGLTGYAAQMFAPANQALGIDDALGAAMVNGVHNPTQAQAAYDAFAPNVSGGSRAIAIAITDQATGVVGAHQRALRMYAKDPGGMSLWVDEFAQMIKDPGQGAINPTTGYKELPGFKDHGFGFALGIDGGSPKYGWYGGAFTFYAGDVNEFFDPTTLQGRDSHTNQQWYILSLYSVWRGTGLFFDSKIDAGYAHIDGKRFINLEIPCTTSSTGTCVYTREADNKHGGALLSGGFSTGAMLAYGAATFMPQISVDGLLMREDGYTEGNPGSATVGDGFDLKVQPYYAQSLRAFIGADVRYDIDLWDFYLQPEARAGYRYDFFADPAKLKAAFAYADTSGGTPTPGQQFTLRGPDPAQGNFVVGGTISATTDTWTMNFNYDLVRGSNGAMEEVGTINLLGRI
jgi:Autotransporter beta-domain